MTKQKIKVCIFKNQQQVDTWRFLLGDNIEIVDMDIKPTNRITVYYTMREIPVVVGGGTTMAPVNHPGLKHLLM